MAGLISMGSQMARKGSSVFIDVGGGTPPNDPTNFTVVYNSDTSLALACTDNSDNETGFEFDVSLTGVGDWSNVTTTPANTPTHTDTSLTVDTQYFYRVRAVNTYGNSNYATANGTTTAPAGIVITGTGFGTAAPVILRDTGEYDLPNGTEIPLDNWNKNGGTWANKFYVDTVTKFGSRSSSMVGLKKCELYGKKLREMSGILKVDWFMLCTAEYSSSVIFSQPNRSDKIFRAWDTGAGDNQDSKMSWTRQHFTYEDGGPSWATLNNTANFFHHYEVIIDYPNITCKQDGVIKHQVTDALDRNTSIGQYLDRLGYDMSDTNHINSGQTFNTNLSDITVLDGLACVYLSNSSTWGTGAFRRIPQEHLSWVDGQIVIDKPFFGDLDTTDGNVYAQVMAANGSVQTIGVPTP